MTEVQKFYRISERQLAAFVRTSCVKTAAEDMANEIRLKEIGSAKKSEAVLDELEKWIRAEWNPDFKIGLTFRRALFEKIAELRQQER